MCQGCVEGGLLSQATFDKIEAFNELWEGAEFGPAHIVLADSNIEDEHIRWCLGLLRAALSRNPADLRAPGEDADFMERMEWYADQDRDEMEATIAFLEELLSVPEDER